MGFEEQKIVPQTGSVIRAFQDLPTVLAVLKIELFMTCLWHVYDMLMTCLWHVYDMFMTCLWHVYDMFMTEKIMLWQKIFDYDRKFNVMTDKLSYDRQTKLWQTNCCLLIP